MKANEKSDEALRGAVQALRSRVRTALGQEPADLVLKDCQVVNVYSEEIYQADVVIRGDKIAGVREHFEGSAARVIDCRGLYAAPGLIEPHMHFETTFVAPAELAGRAIVPRGTTALFADMTDCAYVRGTQAARTLLDSAKGSPWRVFMEAPSYAPFMPDIQTTGGTIGLADSLEMLTWPETVSLGEVAYQLVLSLDKDYLSKIAAYRAQGMRINGHSTGVQDKDLNAFIAAGITDDHGCSTFDEILSYLRLGLTLFLVEAPGRRHLSAMLREVVREGIDTRQLCLCIDNTSIFDIVLGGYGYLDYLVQIAIGAGLSPVQAYQMASLNVASHYGMDHLLGSISPGRFADILLLQDLNHFPPAHVFVGGELVATDGEPLWERQDLAYPTWALNSIEFHPQIHADRFCIQAPEGSRSARVRVIHLPAPDAHASNKQLILELPVADGLIQADMDQDVIPLYIVERYGLNGNVGRAFIQGTGLSRGAIASSVSISDSNVVVAGCDLTSVMTCLSALEEIGGGFVVASEDEVLATINLPLLGQMATEPYEGVLTQLEAAVHSARTLGCTLTNPLLTLATTVLPTVPELGMSDYGLINAYSGAHLETVVEWVS